MTAPHPPDAPLTPPPPSPPPPAASSRPLPWKRIIGGIVAGLVFLFALFGGLESLVNLWDRFTGADPPVVVPVGTRDDTGPADAGGRATPPILSPDGGVKERPSPQDPPVQNLPAEGRPARDPPAADATAPAATPPAPLDNRSRNCPARSIKLTFRRTGSEGSAFDGLAPKNSVRMMDCQPDGAFRTRFDFVRGSRDGEGMWTTTDIDFDFGFQSDFSYGYVVKCSVEGRGPGDRTFMGSISCSDGEGHSLSDQNISIRF